MAAVEGLLYVCKDLVQEGKVSKRERERRQLGVPVHIVIVMHGIMAHLQRVLALHFGLMHPFDWPHAQLASKCKTF